LNRNLSKKDKIATTFIAFLLITPLFALFLPQTTATPTTITKITPTSGPVGTTIRIIGEIDTPNGTYTIYFDGEEVKNGTAIEKAVNDKFVVPHRPEGSYNVTLYDSSTKTFSTPVSFAVQAAYYIKAVVPPSPGQLQEGDSLKIWVNVTGGAENTRYLANLTVTDPSGTVYYSDTLLLTNTTNTGHGWGNITYPTDFSLGAHTNYTGTYEIAFNKTLATENFSIGLTNATEYNRFQTVNIKATNYTQPNEHVWVNITFAGKTIFSENVSATSGIIESSWEIPANASYGTYEVTITNSTTPGTIKPVTDTQTFKVVKAFATLQTRIQDINEQPVIDAIVEAYDSQMDKVANKYTNRDGWANFSLEAGSYTIKALRYNFLFNETFIELPPLSKVNVTITCPTYTMLIHVVDSQKLSLQNVQVTVYEWNGSVLVQSGYTDNQGNINFSIKLGRYKVKVHNYSTMLNSEVNLNETMVNLIQNNLPVTIHCKIFNINFSIKTIDYFGQSIPNAIVKIERKVGQEWVKIDESQTKSNGLVSLNNIIGGDYQISVYLKGKLAGIKQLYLDESKQILFKINNYAVIGGYPLEITQLITYLSIALIVAAFSIALTHRRLLQKFLKKKSEEQKSL